MRPIIEIAAVILHRILVLVLELPRLKIINYSSGVIAPNV